MKYDLIIIGAGPAGMAAGIYAARAGLKTTIISKEIGGTANSILKLENWPGFKGPGSELMKMFYKHLKGYDVGFFNSEVQKIEKKGKEFAVKTEKEEFSCKSLIFATGAERKELNIPGEVKFKGKGVSYCSTCDAFFFKNKITAVIGGSDCAAISALTLSDLAKKVYIIYRGEKLRCEDINSKNLEKRKNVEIIYNATPKEIKGKEKVESFVFIENGKNKEIKLDGIFIEIGAVPLVTLAKNLNLKLNEKNYIIVNEEMKTNVPGVFAAGDVTNSKNKQVVIAAAQGAIAAKSASEFLK